MHLTTVAATATLVLCALQALGAEVRVHRNLTYARTPQKELLLDLYIPSIHSGPYPVVLYVHGGGWSGGSKENPPTARLVDRGYAVASINYRLSHEATFPAQIHDCKAAVRWLRANASMYGLTTEKIVAWGGSAGGHLVALLATSGGVRDLEGDLGNAGESSRIQGAIDFFGPTDFFQLNGARLYKRPDTPDSPEARLVGGALAQRRDVVVAANPMAHLTKDDPPMLVLHGDQDDVVPPHQSQLLAAAAWKAGVPIEHHVIPARGHGFRTGRDFD
ncbi:MAG TPA: alpha/beta hydrolase, partial [Bryobacteraceae bacterium]|nr:alpha/beta hydrolase [Bryobacteraceae bacterium]